MPPVPAWNVENRGKVNSRGIFLQCIFEALNESALKVMGFICLMRCASHKGNKSNNPSLQADKPYLSSI